MTLVVDTNNDGGTEDRPWHESAKCYANLTPVYAMSLVTPTNSERHS